MKLGKTAKLLLLFLLLLGFGGFLVILQNGLERLQRLPEEKVYYPETRDLYNGFGLRGKRRLSGQILVESEEQVIYTDRILKLGKLQKEQIPYAAEMAGALAEKTGCEIYMMPVPERVVLEKGYEGRKAEYSGWVSELQEALPEGTVLLDPLPELEKHPDEYLYFRTENNWTMRGAFYGAQAVLRALGMEEENLTAYREYAFGSFNGNLMHRAASTCTDDSLKKSIRSIEGDAFYIYIKGSNPNREELTLESGSGGIRTLKRPTIQFIRNGVNAVIASNYLHSVVEGRGKGNREGNLLLITDSKGKMMISVLSEVFDQVYVSNIDEDADFAGNLEKTIQEHDIEVILWAQDAAEMGRSSYMRALNPLLKEGGDSNE